MPFRLTSRSDEKWKAEGDLPIAASGDGHCVQIGDDIYVLSTGEPSRLLARLSVIRVRPDPFRHRIDLTIGGPRSAVFFDNSSDAIPIGPRTDDSGSFRREASCLDPETVQQLVGACGSHDFSSPSIPVRWSAITLQVETTVARASRGWRHKTCYRNSRIIPAAHLCNISVTGTCTGIPKRCATGPRHNTRIGAAYNSGPA